MDVIRLLFFYISLLLYPISIKPLIYIFQWHPRKTITIFTFVHFHFLFWSNWLSVRRSRSVLYNWYPQITIEHSIHLTQWYTHADAHSHPHHNVNVNHLVTFFQKSTYICVFVCACLLCKNRDVVVFFLRRELISYFNLRSFNIGHRIYILHKMGITKRKCLEAATSEGKRVIYKKNTLKRILCTR